MVAHILYQRGITDPQAMAMFLAGLPPEHDPLLLPDMDRAVARIREASTKGERVAVWGDFDADGLTATAVLQEAFRSVGIEPEIVIPLREQNHGLRADGIRQLGGAGVTLLVTADCGVTDFAGAAAAKESGMDLIVTDHHLPEADGSLPEGFVVCPTRLDGQYPFRRLAGSGVAFKLAQALMGRDAADRLLDLVVLGTVADVVPLRDENRTIVARGLERLKETDRAGLRALLEVAGVSQKNLSGTTIGFYLGPRINAANRMAEPRIAFDLMTATNAEVAKRLAETLDTHNARRQMEMQEGIRFAIENVGHPLEIKEAIKNETRDPVVCVLGEWGSGLNGLVAGDLVQRYCVPAFVGSTSDDGSVAVSARSVPDVNVRDLQFAAFEANPDAFISKGGGHAPASGFSTTVERWPEVMDLLGKVARGVVPIDDLIPFITVDAQTGLHRLKDLRSMDAVEMLEPFGHGFEAPVFMVSRVCLADKRTFGDRGKHLRMKAKSGNDRVNAVIYNCDPEIADIPEDTLVDIVVNYGREDFKGTFAPELKILDWRYSSEPTGN